MSSYIIEPQNVCYCTDVEGNYEYWNRYIALSKALTRDSSTNRLVLTNNYKFVYGGDVCDRGSGDLRFLDDLNNLYDDYPGRVHFILGNRDVNKMRVPIELHSSYLEKPGRVYWSPADSNDDGNRVERMKWILGKTMGSPGGFEYRKEELNILGKSNSDDDVVQSYIDQCTGADSPILKYLARGVISIIIGNVLFCHGGLNEVNMGWLPPTPIMSSDEGKNDITTRPGPIGGDICDDFISWTEELNRRCKADVMDFIDRSASYLEDLNKDGDYIPSWGEVGTYDHPQPGSRVGYLGMAMIPGPEKTVNPSVIYATYMAGGMPVEITKGTSDKLKNSGITRVIVGHQPHGDAPTVIQAHDLQVIMGDTSYSAGTLWNYDNADIWAKRSAEQLADDSLGLTGLPIAKDNTRGVTVSEIHIKFPNGTEHGAESRVYITGILSDGSTYDFEQADVASNKYVGKMTDSKEWMVKASNVTVKNGPLKGRSDVYLLSRGEGFNFKNKFVPAEEMEVEMAK
jgi:hypothetical protein